MTDTQIEVVGWIAVVFLALAALLWLADAVLGIVKSDEQRKILNRTIGGTFLGGIVAAAVAVLGGDDGDAPPDPPPTSTPTTPAPFYNPGKTPSPAPTSTATSSPPSTPIPTPTPAPTSSGAPTPPSPEPEVAVSCLLPHPSSIRQRADSELGERPDLGCYKKEPYPTCVADLQSLPLAEVSKLDARDCSLKVEEWRKTYVTPAEAARVKYLPNLSSAARKSSGEGSDWLDHINTEINRMNGTSWKDYNAVVKRSQTDMDRCWNNKCAAETSDAP